MNMRKECADVHLKTETIETSNQSVPEHCVVEGSAKEVPAGRKQVRNLISRKKQMEKKQRFGIHRHEIEEAGECKRTNQGAKESILQRSALLYQMNKGLRYSKHLEVLETLDSNGNLGLDMLHVLKENKKESQLTNHAGNKPYSTHSLSTNKWYLCVRCFFTTLLADLNRPQKQHWRRWQHQESWKKRREEKWYWSGKS